MPGAQASLNHFDILVLTEKLDSAEPECEICHLQASSCKQTTCQTAGVGSAA